MRREEIPDIPEPALREAVINAVCHRDYFDKSSSVIIEIYDDRVEISNPGGLPPGLNPKDFGTKSVTRNPIIASLLNRANYIERIGTGINRIKESVKKHKHGTVEFSFDTFFKVIFRKKTRNKKNEKVTENQMEILIAINKNKNITATELSAIVGISDRKIKENIKKLKSLGLLQRIGAARGGHWNVLK